VDPKLPLFEDTGTVDVVAEPCGDACGSWRGEGR